MSSFLRIGDRCVNLDLIVAAHKEASRLFVHYWPGNTWSYKNDEGGNELWEAVTARATAVYNADRRTSPTQG